MTIQSYMTSTGQVFWSSVSVSILIGLAEWITFLFYVKPCVKDFFFDRRNLPWHLLSLALIEVLGLRHYPVHLHVLLLLIICSAYICLITKCSWFNGVLEGTFYCLILELGKSACRDGLAAYALSSLYGITSEHGLNSILLVLYLIFLAVLCLLLSRRRHRLLNLEITTLQALGLLYPLFLYLAVRFFQYDFMDLLTNKGWILYDLLNYAVAVCALLNLSATESMLAAQIRQSEYERQQLLMEQKQLQYEQQLRSIDDINRRYHDLKHYIQGFEALLSGAEAGDMPQRSQTEAFLSSLRQEIDPYSHIRQTGNPVMDVLLSQRIRECAQKNIRLLPFVDARQIGFISTLDLCTLFGNAMDNAMEAAEALPDPKEDPAGSSLESVDGQFLLKEISVKIGTSDGFLLMRFHNYYQGQRLREGTDFHTTKSSESGHGYGLRSISNIAEKYGGTVTVDCGEHEFTLHILIPLQ